jgi:hypothetical protein
MERDAAARNVALEQAASSAESFRTSRSSVIGNRPRLSARVAAVASCHSGAFADVRQEMNVLTSHKPAPTRKAILSVASATALLASASFAAAGEEYGFIKYNNTQFNQPIEIRIKKVDGNMSMRNDNVSIPIQYEAGYNGTQSWLEKIDLRVEHISKGNGEYYQLRQHLSADGKDKVWGTTSITLNRGQIEPMEKYGKELCASHAGNQDKRIDTVIPLTMHVSYYDNASIHKFVKSTVVPAAIICEPDQPSNPAKLLQVKLGTTAQQCHKPIALTALFAATLPAHYKFKLQRGDGETQDASVFPAMKDGPFYRGQWTKVYTFNASETRKYRIVSEKFEPLTDWVTISVQCPVSEQPRPNNNFANPPRKPLPQTNARPVNQQMPVASQPPRAPRHLKNLKK